MIQKQKGFIAFLTVILLLVFCFSLTLGVTYLSIGESQSSLAMASGAEAFSLTSACTEDALLLSLRDINYVGGDTNYLGGTCTIQVSKDADLWTLDVSGTKNEFTRSIQVRFVYTIGTPNTIKITQWIEQ